MHTCNKEQRLRFLPRVGKALAHPARARILELLAQGERCGCEIAPQVGLDPSVVSRHLALLAGSGLVRSRRDGVRLMWRLADERVLGILDELGALAEGAWL